MKNKNEEKRYGGTGKIALVNSITALRFLGSFLVIPIFKAIGGVGAAIYSAIFMFTDSIDGFLARKMKASTFFGSIFDGVTDKTFIILTFALLIAFNPLVFSVPLLIELGILAVQNKKMKKGLNVKSSFIGKAKTWVLSASMVISLAAVELLDLKPVFEYLKTATLSKTADIKDLLVLLGINLPGIIMQILTLNSYKKDLNSGEEKNLSVNDKLSAEEETFDNAKEKVREPEDILKDIDEERKKLQQEYTLLEKSKILGTALFDPEYYDKNKDKQIRVLTKELFTKDK